MCRGISTWTSAVTHMRQSRRMRAIKAGEGLNHLGNVLGLAKASLSLGYILLALHTRARTIVSSGIKASGLKRQRIKAQASRLKRHQSAASSGHQWPQCRAYVAGTPRAVSSLISLRPCGVSMKPGQTVLQRTPRSRNSTAWRQWGRASGIESAIAATFERDLRV